MPVGFFLPGRTAIVSGRCHATRASRLARVAAARLDPPSKDAVPDSLTSTLTSYCDAVPCESHPFLPTAVEHLEAIAFLFGLRTPAPAQARVLNVLRYKALLVA